MDPNQVTRREFTRMCSTLPCPDEAVTRYRRLLQGLQKVLRLLGEHSAMQPNIDQSYGTPAASKNKVYFMWDFIGRTISMLDRVDPKLPNTAASNAQWNDVEGRATMAGMLIKDQSGQLERIMGSSGDVEGGIEFGADIERAIDEATE